MLVLGNKLTLNALSPTYHFVNKYSIVFDGADQCIITDGADTVAQPTTYSFWIKSSHTAYNYGVFGHGSFNQGSFQFNNGNKPLLELGGSYYRVWTDIPAQDDGEWHHWVVYADTNDITNSKLYVDGVLQTVTNTVSSGSAAAYTESLTIGGDQAVGGNYFVGNIDEFAVFDRELTQAEITRMYNTFYSPNRVANGNFSQIGNEEVENGDFSEVGAELVTNGDFATDSDWSTPTGWDISDGKLKGTNLSFVSATQTGYSSFVGKTFEVVYTISDYSQGDVRLFLGGSVPTTNRSEDGTFTEYIFIDSGNTILFIQGINNFTGNIDNVSVKEVGQDWEMNSTAIFTANGINITTGGFIRQDVLTSGKSYQLTYDIISYTSGNIRVYDGTDQGSIPTVLGSNTFNFTAGGTSFYIQSNSVSVNLVIDNVSVKEVGQGWGITNNTGTNTRIENNHLIIETDGTYTQVIQSNVLIIGRNYKLVYDVAATDGGDLGLETGGATSLLQSTIGTHTFNWVSNSTTFNLKRYGGALNITIDNVVVQELKHDATNLMLNAGAYQSANPLITSTNSMYFSGPDEYLQLSEPFNYTNHTITSWIKSSQDTGVGVIFDGRDGTNDNVAIYLNNGVLYYNLGGFATNSVSSIATGKWVNITCSYDGATAKIYLDGVLANSVSGVGTISSTKNAVIGVNFLDFQEYVGNATEIGTYNRTLTSLEVASLYNQGMPTNLLVNRNDYQSGNPTVFNTKQVDFDGSDDYLQLSEPFSYTNHTISCWVKNELNTGTGIIFDSRDAGGDGIILFIDNLLVKSRINSIALNTTNVLSTNVWHNITQSYDGSVAKLYIDGVLVISTSSSTVISTTTNARIGTGSYLIGSNFDGQMSQLGLFSSALTADEVSSLYNHGLPVDLTTNQAAYTSSSNLVGYWRMGSGTLDSYPLIADQTNATLGSELVVNGDFATDSNWVKGANTTISGGKLNSNSAGVYIIANQSGILAQNQVCKYSVTYTITSGSVRLGDSSSVWAGSTQSTSGTYTGYITVASTANGTLFFTSSASDFVGSIDNVSVKQVNGNPAMMINLGGGADFSDGIKNGSPYANLVQDSNFSNDLTDWTAYGTTSATGGIATIGASSNSGIYQGILTNGVTYTVTVNVTSYDGVGSVEVVNGLGNNLYTITETGIQTFVFTQSVADANLIVRGRLNALFSVSNVTVAEVNTGLQGYWKMGSGINDEYPIIQDQTNLTVGSQLVINGDFSNGNTGWNTTNGSITVTNGIATVLSTNTDGGIFQSISQAGSTYFIEIDVLSINSGTWYAGGYITSIYQIDNIGKISFYYTSSGTGFHILSSSATGSITIDNVSVKKLQGNPATMTNMVEGNITNQYPLTKIRNYYRMGDGILDKFPCIQDQTSPNIAHIPTTNLLTYSQDFANAAWSKVGTTVTSGFVAPDGTNDAFELVGASGTDRSSNVLTRNFSAGNYTFSIYVKSAGSTQIRFYFRDGTTGSIVSQLFSLTTEYQRLIYSHNVVNLSNFYIGNTNGDVIIYGSQLEVQHQATAYLPSYGVASVRKATTTNIALYSEDFTQSYWIKNNTTILSNQTISPDGITNADSIIANSTNSTHYIRNNYTAVTASTSFTYSINIKPNGYNKVGLRDDAQTGAFLTYNLNTKSIISSASMRVVAKELSNGWFKLSFTYLGGSNGVIGLSLFLLDDNYVSGDPYSYSFAGDNTSGFYIWGNQIEEQTQAETYAPTFGLPVTIDLFTENNYGTMINMTAGDIVPDTPNN